MKITCQTEDLKKTLQAVQRAVASKGILPVLSNVLLTTDSDSGRFLKLVGTDLEIGIETRLEAEVSEAIHTTLPAKKWFEIVSKFPDEAITLEFKSDGTVTLIGQKLTFHLNTLPADDFPRLPQVQRDKVIELNLLEFSQAIRQTCFAAATDSAKTILTGVNVQIQAGQLKLAATDGYRLAVRQLTLAGDSPSATAIIPRRTLLELEKLVKQDGQETLLMSLAENHVLFESQDK
ncbi:MAG: DNA polymerase III subunit beta, partial [Candidatus Sericytochromatia bacterium]